MQGFSQFGQGMGGVASGYNMLFGSQAVPGTPGSPGIATQIPPLTTGDVTTQAAVQKASGGLYGAPRQTLADLPSDVRHQILTSLLQGIQ